MSNVIYKGDDTNAFGQNLLKINFTTPEGWNISKAEFRCGKIKKTFNNPVSPIVVNFSNEETSMLNFENPCYLAIYDENNLKYTCEGSITLIAKNEVV